MGVIMRRTQSFRTENWYDKHYTPTFSLVKSGVASIRARCHLPEMSAKGTEKTLRLGRGTGGRPAPFPPRRTDPGPTGGSPRTSREVGAAQPSSGSVAGPARGGDAGRSGRHELGLATGGA